MIVPASILTSAKYGFVSGSLVLATLTIGILLYVMTFDDPPLKLLALRILVPISLIAEIFCIVYAIYMFLVDGNLLFILLLIVNLSYLTYRLWPIRNNLLKITLKLYQRSH